jgi:hypothetical protein
VETRSSSTRLLRTSALLYLLLGIVAAFNFDVVLATVYVPGDPAATGGSVLANTGLVRIGTICELDGAACFALLAVCLYGLLGAVDRTLARAMVNLVAIGATFMCVDKALQVGALQVAIDGSFAAAFGSAGAQALVHLLVTLELAGSVVAGVFFGLWLVPLAANPG